MQFFPDASLGGVSALGGVSLSRDSSGSSGTPSDGNDFLNSLNEELAAAGLKPVANSSSGQGSPNGFRKVKQDVSSKLGAEDAECIMDKLRKRGVDDSALAGIEGLLASNGTLTLGNIMGTLRGNGRMTDDLTDEELKDIAAALQKLQFSAEEADEITQMMLTGRGHEAMRLLSARAKELGEGGISLNRNEVNALMRGLDLSENAMKKVAALLGADESAEFDAKALESLLGPASEELAKRKDEMEKAAAQIKDVIDEALREKKVREKNAAVADTRGSQLTERAEKRMRDDLTAKANGFGPKSKEELEEEEAALADQQADDDRRQHSRKKDITDQRMVTVRDTGRDKAATEKEAPSSAKEAFSPVLSRVDAANGLTAPSQPQPATPQQNPSTAFTHRQEIFSQVEQGMLRQLSDGTTRMTLQLNPVDLGQLSVVLSVKGGEVRALIRAENPETTAALSEQMSQLKATLEEQGLKVAQLDVETQLPEDTTREQWTDMKQFNREQEMREQQRFQRLAKIRRESGTNLAQEMQSKGMREENSASGLHIIA